MNSLILTRIALRSLQKHKGRSLLTMLGIILGIGGLVATLALGYGAEKKVQEQIEAYGNNYIQINPGNWLSKGKTKSSTKGKGSYIKAGDMKALAAQCPEMSMISPWGGTNESVSYQNNYLQADIRAGNESFFAILNRKVKKGSSFTHYHLIKNSRVVILGEKAASELFKTVNPLGKQVNIGKTTFTVIGILDTVKDMGNPRDPNLDVYVPYSTLQKFVTRSNKDRIQLIVISAKQRHEIPVLVRRMRNILRDRHHLIKGDPDDFMIWDQQSMAHAARGASKVLQLVLLIIASISLLIGGVGVMNIMLVSVTERTKEIGIRMALGATDRLILNQFVLESIMLCLIGGIIGIAVGITFPCIVSYFTGLYVVFKPISVLVAFAVTSFIGIFFGYYPAYKASRLKPVIALADV